MVGKTIAQLRAEQISKPCNITKKNTVLIDLCNISTTSGYILKIMAKKISLTEQDYVEIELKDLRFFLHQTTHGSISCHLDRLTFSLACLVGHKVQVNFETKLLT